MTRNGSVIAIVASAICFATMGVLTKIAFGAGADPESLLTWRFVIAALGIAVLQLLRDPGQMKVRRSDLGSFALLALTGYGLASMCYAYAVREIGASVTTVLLYTYPALVCVIGRVFLGQALPPRRIAAIALTFLGCVLVADVLGSSTSVTWTGLLLGLGAGLGYALFNVMSYRVVGRRPRMVVMAYTFAMASVGVALFATVTSGWPSPARWEPTAWVALALIVLIPTFAAVTLYLGGIRGLGAPQAALISTIELPATILMASALVGERLGPPQWAGAALVLAGVVLAEWGSAGVDMDASPAV